MLHDLTPASSAMFDHLRARFPGRDVAMLPPAPRPTHERVPALHILSVTPPEGGRLYATAGLWDATQVDGHGLEFVLRALAAEDRVHVETLTMAAYCHSGGGHHALDHGHTVPIGRPWMRRSRGNHLLVSLPYPWGGARTSRPARYRAGTSGCCGRCPSPRPRRPSGTLTAWRHSNSVSRTRASSPPIRVARPWFPNADACCGPFLVSWQT